MVEQTGFEQAEVAGSPAEAVSPACSHEGQDFKPRGATGQSGRLTKDQVDFIDWLCTPQEFREPSSQNAWERDHGYGAGTCSRWKNTNVGFRAVLQTRYDEINTSPDQIQEVINELRNIGLRKGDAKALVDWMKVTGAYVEKKETVKTGAVQEMTNQELIAELHEELAILEAQEQLS